MIPRSRRLAVVLSHPTQYYSPWFRWLRAHTRLEFRVFYLWNFGVVDSHDKGFTTRFKWDIDLLSGYDSEFVPNSARHPGTEHFWGLRNPTLGARLAAWGPDAILLFGYNWATHLAAIAWARVHRIPLLFRGDSHLIGRPNPGFFRSLSLRLLYRQFAAVTYVGAANRAYFVRFGVPPERLFFAPHAVDDTLFDPRAEANRAAAAALRKQLNLAPSARVVLFAGKLLPAKQPRELLCAFESVASDDSVLVFSGDGPERAGLEERARISPRGRQVHFLPFANQSEMPARYLLADIFTLPSRGLYETWGLAVNEAMHMGLPCLVSDRVGCQQDLVSDSETGWVFRASDEASLRERLASALSADLAPYRARVAERISRYTYATAAAGLESALDSL